MSPADRLKLAEEAEARAKTPCPCGTRNCGCKREVTHDVRHLADALREAEAERARWEKIAMAERALREAEAAFSVETWRDVPKETRETAAQFNAARGAVGTARAALRALGVEP